ncbi:MAG: 23S rRNA (uracil(1939)-C(5))-methyltransferase RlmD [Candidatus Woesearchaeota archaeon]
MNESRCPYFRECGGCESQHIPYDVQLENKKKTVSRIIGCKEEEIRIFSDKKYSYRNRMDFIFHRGGLGLRKKGDWKHIIDVESCAISDGKLNILLSEIRTFFKNPDAFDPIKKNGTLKYAVIRTPKDNSAISFVLNEDSSRTGEVIEQIKLFAQKTTAQNVIITYVPKESDMSISNEFFAVKGSDMLTEEYCDKTFEYSVQGFFQNNSAMAEIMQNYVHSLLKKYDTKKETLLDLYGGVGTFGIINAELFSKVLTVENDQNCIDAALRNIKQNKTINADAKVIDAMSIRKLNLPQRLYVITDPPRSGMHQKTIDELKRLKPKVIIYISCNVEQLGKELKRFPEYTLKSVAMCDLFPQTPHMEAIVELVRNKEYIDS